jgi:hypothetical protein
VYRTDKSQISIAISLKSGNGQLKIIERLPGSQGNLSVYTLSNKWKHARNALTYNLFKTFINPFTNLKIKYIL